MVALILLRGVVGVGEWLVSKFGKKKKSKMEEMAEQYGKHRAKEFNVGDGKRDTGARALWSPRAAAPGIWAPRATRKRA
jgi:hypothetical protein